MELEEEWSKWMAAGASGHGLQKSGVSPLGRARSTAQWRLSLNWCCKLFHFHYQKKIACIDTFDNFIFASWYVSIFSSRIMIHIDTPQPHHDMYRYSPAASWYVSISLSRIMICIDTFACICEFWYIKIYRYVLKVSIHRAAVICKVSWYFSRIDSLESIDFYNLSMFTMYRYYIIYRYST